MGVGGQKKTNLVNIVCERPLRPLQFEQATLFLTDEMMRRRFEVVTQLEMSIRIPLQCDMHQNLD